MRWKSCCLTLVNLPDIGEDDERNLVWVKLIRQVREQLHEPPDSPASQQLAVHLIDVSMEWFGQDEQLIEKYWGKIRSEEGEELKVYGMDAQVMEYMDRIVDWYLQHSEEGTNGGGESAEETDK
ncbi:MerR family transcriptional regulator [Paenibacillus herberti]|uniref:MerR family transcriptional regulator n=1 Tax=Paenibacillus herberti TaxID=1619309 RepID=UPI001FE768EC|nr:MerR family transcriptional regulator [Paenibacillus herberti]